MKTAAAILLVAALILVAIHSTVNVQISGDIMELTARAAMVVPSAAMLIARLHKEIHAPPSPRCRDGHNRLHTCCSDDWFGCGGTTVPEEERRKKMENE
uniref:VAN3-binding protein-like auxin canalisation domain-containing protein n=1 Tax=Oryza sativa subsp. japonica TaxID=39947 RepID=Q6ZAC5_ORYSJ|nr:hypothetical protein [Oryza sativa Japonica Group]BAD09821.1 hypothetical protein [Oryza sativa Japonica Group]